ncbi:helix-turn-helix domain-containing protein [Lacticaseibacillus sp. N501-2]|uniref:helix-turn-helix domain-containing protein n=1 Tax=Lacticaseibacillus salsurae TaxID=3367729 RepID=UPI0038B235C0
MKPTNIGAFVRQVRKDRHLSLDDAVVDAGCSAASLSRFERDQSDLSLASMRQILHNIQLTYYDLEHFQEQRQDNLARLAYFLFIAQDLANLSHWTSNFRQAHRQHADKPSIQFAQLVLTSTLRQNADHTPLTTDAEQLMSDFLQPFAGWRLSVHTLAIAAGLTNASHELLATITERLVAYSQRFNAQNIGEAVVGAADLAHLAIHLLAHRETKLLNQLYPALCHYQTLRQAHKDMGTIEAEAVHAAPLVMFVGMADAWVVHQDPSAAKQIAGLCAQLDALECTDLAGYLRRCWAMIQSGRTTWHNHALRAEDRQLQTDQWRFDGATIAQIRQLYHLQLADVALDWTTATQSRFETGKTQLGFRAVLTLSNTLLLDARLLYENYFSDMQVQLFQTFNQQLGPAKVVTPQTVTNALQTALAQAPKQPAGRYLMVQGSLTARAAMHLVNQGMTWAQVADFFDEKTTAEAVMNGFCSIKHLQVSDLALLINCSSLLNAQQQITAWQWLKAHADFDLQHTRLAAILAGEVMYACGMQADVDAIKTLNPEFEPLWVNRVWPSSTVASSGAHLIAKAYLHPENATQIWATINENAQTMVTFAQPKPETEFWIGNMFQSVVQDIQPVYQAWLAKRA